MYQKVATSNIATRNTAYHPERAIVVDLTKVLSLDEGTRGEVSQVDNVDTATA
jgi:hypothetical protein